MHGLLGEKEVWIPLSSFKDEVDIAVVIASDEVQAVYASMSFLDWSDRRGDGEGGRMTVVVRTLDDRDIRSNGSPWIPLDLWRLASQAMAITTPEGKLKVIVVGAGICGLACGAALREFADVTVSHFCVESSRRC